ncbi:orotidine 5'-phosphate decarboxylase / HUMPS family protein [Micromonospora sp. NPDC051141]|uniref:orotidine 5'-phosphate decarboxylase / HUMPS family protein n=1 Tax=Micromonospora sp. NPDC051141 TaxID=3364284 RepID=UPI0037885EAB
MKTARRIIVALDFDNVDDAEAIVDRLGNTGQAYKVGMELLTVAGPTLARRLVGEGKDVFLDLKLLEIPTSVAGAVRAAGRLGATMVTVHAMGGPKIMEAAVHAAAGFPQLRVIALTGRH